MSTAGAPVPAVDVLPYDVTAERVVLSSLLLLPKEHAAVLQELDPSLFRMPDHRLLFEAFRAVGTVDPANVTVWLTERRHHEAAALVPELTADVASA